MMKNFNYLIFFIIFSLFPFFSYGAEFSVSNESSLILKLRPGQKITAGFIDITVNQDAKIIQIEGKMIGRIEAHSMVMNGEIMKMRKITPDLVKNIKYKFKPGGNHLMLFDVDRELKTGNYVNLLFTFQLKNKKIFTKSIKFKVK
jgi:copper(I)-binding protein